MTKKVFYKKGAIEFNKKHNEQGLSLRKVAFFYKTNHLAVRRALEKYGYPHRNRQYFVDEDFFKKPLDTLVKLYIIGWLYGDGYIFADEIKRYFGFRLKLQQQDQYILEHIKNIIRSTHPIKSDKHKGRVYPFLIIGSKKMYGDLVQYGLIPNKTQDLTYPKNK